MVVPRPGLTSSSCRPTVDLLDPSERGGARAVETDMRIWFASLGSMLALASALGVGAAVAQAEAPGPNPSPPSTSRGLEVTARDKAFFQELRSAVDKGDRAWLASLPCGVKVNRKSGASQDYSPAKVARAYDKIITPAVKRAIDAQDPDQLFKRDMGVMVGDGEVWFSEVGLHGRWVYCIVAVNQDW